MTLSIPTFNLYGELGDLPDIIHIETIESRASLLDWQVGAHRHTRLHQVLSMGAGGGVAVIDTQHHELSTGSLVNAPASTVHEFAFTPGTQGHVLTLPSELLDQCLAPNEGLRPLLERPACFSASDEIRQTIDALATQHRQNAFGRAQILRGLAQVLLGQLARALYEQREPDASDTPATSGTLDQFAALIEQQYLSHWRVAEYAQALGISPTHLTRLAREATGRSASGLIEDRMIREARRTLAYTQLPISRVAYELGFEDPAYFSRVFRRATGLSPRSFRNSARG